MKKEQIQRTRIRLSMKWYHLVLGAFVAGVVCFAVLKWIFHFDNNNSIGASLAAAAGGLIAEYVRVYMMRKKMNRSNKR